MPATHQARRCVPDPPTHTHTHVHPPALRRRVYLIPPGSCPFVGLGYVGCDGSYPCRSWIGGDFWTTPEAITHELGHNLFLAHAGTWKPDGSFDEYGDQTGAMGYCCEPRCFNTPQSWQMGWLSVQHFDASNLRAGQTVETTLASQATSVLSGVRIKPTWLSGGEPIFMSLRTRAGGDALLSAAAANKVHIHTSPIEHSFDSQLTTWHAALAVNQSWENAAAGVVLRLKALKAGRAAVSICRKGPGGKETLETCSKGIDNDCNGTARRGPRTQHAGHC